MRWMVLLFALSFAQNVSACEPCENPFVSQVTLANPASYRLVYTGIVGLLFDEYVKFISTKGLEDISYRYSNDAYMLRREIRLINEVTSDYKRKHYADKRKEWWHYTSSWSWKRTYTSGPSRDIINIGPFRVNNKFKFKLKSYTTDLTSEWSFKFKPRVTFTSKLPLVKRATVQCMFTYRVKNKKILRITVAVGANFKRRDGEILLYIDFLGWGS